MKKFYLLFVVIGLSLLRAQTPISVTSSSMPSSGDTIRYSVANAQGANTALTGANVFWNFDTLQPLSQDVYQYKSSLQTPYAFYFLGINQYGLKVADTVGFGTFQFLDVYSFFKKTNSFFSAEGTGFKYQGIPLASQYSDDDEIYTFPLNFGDQDSTTYSVTTGLGGTISYAQKGYRINVVDGWGTIKTPYDSVKCLRLISTSYGVDSVNFNGFGFSFPNVQRTYKWLTTGEKIPMLEISGQFLNGNFTPNQLRYRDTYQGVTTISETKHKNIPIEFYPIPAKDKIYCLNAYASGLTLQIFTMEGKQVVKSKIQQGNNEISLSEYSSGIYQAVVTDDTGKLICVKKIIME